jgi:hypothetical protein
MKSNTMKVNFFSGWMAGLTVSALMLGSCDKLDPPYATIAGQDIDTTNKKTILIEDYTGIKCVNCPSAAVVAHTLENLYKHKVVVMAVHAGYYAQPDASGLYTADYRTPEGTAWFTGYGLIATPMGMVDRVTVNSTKAIMVAIWSSTVQSEFLKIKEANISIAATASKGAPTVGIHVVTNFLTAKQGTWMLNVCVVEDSIISPQKNNDPLINNGKDVENYVHMNMLRKTITGENGEVIARNPASGNYSAQYTLTLDPVWKPNHLSLVVFISDSATGTILQAGKKNLSGL